MSADDSRRVDSLLAEAMGWTLRVRGGTGKYRDSKYWEGSSLVVDWHWRPSEQLDQMAIVENRLSTTEDSESSTSTR